MDGRASVILSFWRPTRRADRGIWREWTLSGEFGPAHLARIGGSIIDDFFEEYMALRSVTKALFEKADPITRLEMQRDRLRERIVEAVATVDRAVDLRRTLLTTPDAPEEQIEAAGKAVRQAMDERSSLEDAARAVAAMLEDAYRGRAAEQERADRATIAKETEARADRIAAACKALDAAGQAYARARETLDAVIAADGLVPPLWSGGALAGPVAYAAARIAAPSLVDMDREKARLLLQPFHVGAVEAGTALHVEPLRQAAREIAAGTLPAAAPVSPAPPTPEVRIERTRIVLSEPVQWNGENGAPVQAPEGDVELPVPVAEAAINQGIGFPPNTRHAVDVMAFLSNPDPVRSGLKPNTDVKPIARKGPPYKDLGVSLFAWIETERARLMQARAAA